MLKENNMKQSMYYYGKHYYDIKGELVQGINELIRYYTYVKY